MDRLAGSKDAILVGYAEEQLVVDRKQLPAGTREGPRLRVDVRDDVLIQAEIDEGEMAPAKTRAQREAVPRKGSSTTTAPHPKL